MDQDNNSSTDLFRDLNLDHTAKQYIATMGKWALLIAIFTFIRYATTILELVSPRRLPGDMDNLFNASFQKTGTISSIVTIVAGSIVCYFLIRFASQSRKALYLSDQQLLNDSFASLKNYFVVLCIMVVATFLLGLLGGALVLFKL